MELPATTAASPIAVELRHLRYFLAVVDELHFGRAAKRLRMAQPPLSQAIRKLEDELGVQLLHRTSRVVTSTEAGRVFAEHARETLTSLDQAIALARRAGGAGAVVRLGCSPTQPMEEVGRILQALRQRLPGLEVPVSDLLIADQVRLLRQGQLGLGLFPSVGEIDGIATEAVFPGEPVAAFLSVDHPLASKRVLSPDDVSGETLITVPQNTLTREFRDRYLRFISDAGYRFGSTRDAGGSSARELMLPIAAGLGIALHRASLGGSGGASGVVVSRGLDPPLTLPDTVLAWSLSPPAELDTVIEVARETARELRRAPLAAPSR